MRRQGHVDNSIKIVAIIEINMSQNFNKRHGNIVRSAEKIKDRFTGSEARKKKRRWHIATAIVLAASFCSAVLFQYTYQDRFYPGVFIGNVSVEGKTLAEVTTYFAEKEKILKNTGIHFDFVDGTPATEVVIPMSAPGLTPDRSFEYFSLGDWRKTLVAAYTFGRTGDLWQRIREQLELVSSKKFDLPYNLYDVSVDSLITQELNDFLREPVSAKFSTDKSGKIIIVSEQPGEMIHKTDIVSALRSKLASFDTSTQVFKTTVVSPKTTAKKLAPFLSFAEELSQNAFLIFKYKSYEKKVRGVTLATWLSAEDGELATVDQEKVDDFLSGTVALNVENPAQNGRFEIQGKKLKEIVVGKPGTVIDIPKTSGKLNKVLQELQRSFSVSKNDIPTLTDQNGNTIFNADSGEIDIAIETTSGEPKATQTTIDKLKISELVGTAKTTFKTSSADRIHNITTGASKLNGLLIAPGQEFSTVDAIGNVGAAYGFVKEYVIKDNQSVKEFGGGLCQVATTLFRAVLNAGLPVTERINHRYVVSYYGPGLDATIYGPHPDLRFVNDTGHFLLLQAKVKNAELTIEFYGQNDGRKVTISDVVLSNRIPAPPTKYVPTWDLPFRTEKCSETPRQGVTANVDYTVTFASGDTKKQHFTSVYEPWQKICLFGTRM